MKRILPVTDIYAITDSRQSLGRSTVDVVREMLKAGIRIIQYREKDAKAGQMLEECLAIREMTKQAECCFIVNDYVDIALLCDADGVHVGQEDLPLSAVRRLIGEDKIIGVSTHKEEEARIAIQNGADYIGVGPLYATNTKKDAEPVGLSYLENVSSFCSIPHVAIGGVNEKTLSDVVKYGADICCMVSAITLAEDIPAKVAELQKSIIAYKKKV